VSGLGCTIFVRVEGDQGSCSASKTALPSISPSFITASGIHTGGFILIPDTCPPIREVHGCCGVPLIRTVRRSATDAFKWNLIGCLLRNLDDGNPPSMEPVLEDRRRQTEAKRQRIASLNARAATAASVVSYFHVLRLHLSIRTNSQPGISHSENRGDLFPLPLNFTFNPRSDM